MIKSSRAKRCSGQDWECRCLPLVAGTGGVRGSQNIPARKGLTGCVRLLALYSTSQRIPAFPEPSEQRLRLPGRAAASAQLPGIGLCARRGRGARLAHPSADLRPPALCGNPLFRQRIPRPGDWGAALGVSLGTEAAAASLDPQEELPASPGFGMCCCFWQPSSEEPSSALAGPEHTELISGC